MESQVKNAVDAFITMQLNPHEVKQSDKLPDSIFWVKDGEIIVEFDSSLFWVHSNIWDSIENMFGLSHETTSNHIRAWYRNHYDIKAHTSARAEVRPQYWNQVFSSIY